MPVKAIRSITIAIQRHFVYPITISLYQIYDLAQVFLEIGVINCSIWGFYAFENPLKPSKAPYFSHFLGTATDSFRVGLDRIMEQEA
jgi:hypothetical protein